MNYKTFKPTHLKVFTFLILFLLLLSTEPSDVSFSSRGTSPISILKALIIGLNLKIDTYFIILILLIVSYFLICLVFYVLSEEAIEVYKKPARK